jgi:hypothetical protein
MRWRDPGPIRHPPGFIEPCLPTLAGTVPTGSQWVYEIKHDGFRFAEREAARASSPHRLKPARLGRL